MKLLSIMWASYVPLLKAAAEETGVFELKAYSSKQLNLDPGLVPDVRRDVRDADFILFYRTEDAFWEEVEEELAELGGRTPVAVVGPDPSHWRHSTVSPETVATLQRYILFNGAGNFQAMLRFLAATVFGVETSFDPPVEEPWEGVHHPDLDGTFHSTDAYLERYPLRDLPLVGLLYPRSNRMTGNLEVERHLVRALESRGMGVLPVFLYSMKDGNLGNLGGEEVVRKFFTDGDGKPRIEAVVKLTVFFLGQKHGGIKESQAEAGAKLMASLNVPLLNPVISYYKERSRWLEDPAGLGQQIGWSIALPEFEGVIEPLLVGATRGAGKPEDDAYEPVEDRIERLTARVSRWVGLRRKPNAEKKVAFILHNNPCASVEATVGGGAHLDTLESVALALNRMRGEGYTIGDPPANGKELIDTILGRKAISEFRWTTTDEIVAKGGVLARVDGKRYVEWTRDLPEASRARMSEAWGKPPGEEKDGVPAAMVHDGQILVTGVRYGNAVVCVQPKRGCAGARCDGQVCKILHDPLVPPPHQYLATYRWLSREYGADALIHVGTHGNLEFLPGKGTGLSNGCFPDAAVDEMPHLYLYNADNPPEGTIAKRRSCATLVDHMQAVMVRGELYGDLDELERLLADYEKTRDVEPGKAHTIRHMIEKKLKEGNLDTTIRVPEGAPFDEVVKATHEALSLLRNSYIPKGMHVFGKLPEGERFGEFIYAVARYETGRGSLRGLARNLLEADTAFSSLDETRKKDAVEETARTACMRYLSRAGNGNGAEDPGPALLACFDGMPPEVLDAHREEAANVAADLDDIVSRTLRSDEMAALLNGLDGGYIPPGPSGIVTRGRVDILPTGRNFYSLDPEKVPSRVAWEVGVQLARKTLDKYLADEGRYPENIAFYWQCTDIMWSDGEGMAQMMVLLGVRPAWKSNGRLSGFEIIPLEELGRPRIDVTVRVSGITRDNFPSAIEVMDEVVQTVARLDEPPEMNYVRKHTLENLEEEAGETTEAKGAEDVTEAPKMDEDAFRKATYRIFAAMPGVYQAGTQLAVYASAWKDEKDLSDVFLHWNGYAYGKGVFGEPAHRSLKQSLSTVELSFNKTVTDEYDLLGCCAYFGTHGGMINAARVISGKEIRNYYGDTREQGEVGVRDLADEIRRVVRTKLLNPRWIDGMKEHGYKGAGEIGKRVGRVYGWEATSREVDDWIFDDITRTFLVDEENRKFFEENNPYALEEIARRLIEAAERGLWDPAPDVKDALKEIYIEIEGWIEEGMENVEGDFQGGAIDIVTAREVESWKKRLEDALGPEAGREGMARSR